MLFNEFTYWSFGIECETKYKIRMKKNEATGLYPVITSAPLIEFSRVSTGERLMFVYPDMGDNIERTAEIVTEPLLISNISFHKAYKKITQFIILEFYNHHDNTLTKEQFAEDFSKFKIDNNTNSVIQDTQARLLVSAIEIHGSQSNSLNNQISFGIPMSDLHEFIKPLLYDDTKLDWYYPNRHDNLCQDFEACERFAFNYLLCVLIKYCKILNNTDYNFNPDHPSAKNSWRFMPRTPPALVLDNLISEQKLKITKKLKEELFKIFSDNTEITPKLTDAYDNIIMNKSPVGGHTSTLRKIAGPDTENMFVFEIRQPAALFDNYFYE